MNSYTVQEAAVIPGRPEDVYAIIADYHDGHPAILPTRYFTGMTVTSGGRGAGTEATVTMNVFGVKAVYNMTVSEPEPGRILQEEDSAAGVVTTFTIEPLDGGAAARVTIATRMLAAPGFRGWIEKRFNPPIMRRIYREELAQLAQFVQKKEREQ